MPPYRSWTSRLRTGKCARGATLGGSTLAPTRGYGPRYHTYYRNWWEPNATVAAEGSLCVCSEEDLVDKGIRWVVRSTRSLLFDLPTLDDDVGTDIPAEGQLQREDDAERQLRSVCVIFSST